MIRYYILLLLVSISLTAAAAGPDESEPFEYTYSQLSVRDPFAPLVNSRGDILIKTQEGVADIKLQGIIYIDGTENEEGSTVIINNEMYKEGEVFDKYTIIKIQVNGIILDDGEKQHFLKWEG